MVRVPYDEDNGEVYYDENDLDLTKYASSLHFVDLAGSERQNRTKAAGDRLKEAGNINNSLMTLRRCIEALRKNQKSSTGHSEPVPYRSSKITHIFRNFFEVLGGVKLVICINPAAAEFEENLNVLKFAEDAQSIQCKREVKGKYDPPILYAAYSMLYTGQSISLIGKVPIQILPRKYIGFHGRISNRTRSS